MRASNSARSASPGLAAEIRAYDPVRRLASAVVVSVLIMLASVAMRFAINNWTLEDMDVYLGAGKRLLVGQSLYSVTDPYTSYQYAPWFAVLWAPLSLLPRQLVAVGWSAVLLVATAASIWPLVRRPSLGGIALALLMGSILVFASARSGNVQPLMICCLVLGVERRSGPLWVALAASLKGLPLALALVYAGRRQWGRVAASVGLTLALLAPMLLFDVSTYTTDSSRAGTLMRSLPIVWGLIFSATAAAAFMLSRRSHTTAWLTAALTVVLGLPRLLAYDTTYLLVGTAQRTKKVAPNDHVGVP